MVSFELFVRPAIRKLLGHARIERSILRAELAEDIGKAPGRAHYLRAQLEQRGDKLIARPLGKQGSGMLRSMVSVDGLIEVPAESGNVSAGTLVSVISLRSAS